MITQIFFPVLLLVSGAVGAAEVKLALVYQEKDPVPKEVVPVATADVAKEFNDVTGQGAALFRVYPKSDEDEMCASLLDSKSSVILDTTLLTGSRQSDMTKYIAKNLLQPTLATSHGHRLARIDKWEGLSQSETNNMIMIPPTSDVMLYVINDIIENLKLNPGFVGVIYDDSKLVIPYEKSLFVKMGKTDAEMKECVTIMRDASIRHIVIYANPQEASKMLNMAAEAKVGKSWLVLLLRAGEVLCPKCENMNVLVMNPVIQNEQKGKMMDQKFPKLLDYKMEVAFYYELTEMVYRAVAKMKKANKWTHKPVEDCDTGPEQQQKDALEKMNFVNALKEETLTMQGVYGKFVLTNTSTVHTKHYQEVKVNLEGHRFESQGKPAIKTPIGTWTYAYPMGAFQLKKGQTLAQFAKQDEI